MNLLTARIESRRVRALVAVVVCAFVGALACEAFAATLSPELREEARDGPVEVFVWLRPAPASYAEPGRGAFAARARREFRAALSSAHTEVAREFRSIPALVLRADERGLDAIAAHPLVAAVSPMQYGGAALAESVPQIGAAALQEQGLRGEGSVLALLDTGVDGNHADLEGRVDAEECICRGCCASDTDRASGPGSARSLASHGPHVAGIMLSGGVVAAKGVAPAAHLVAVRVLNDASRGSLEDWLEGLDLILAEHPEVVAVNMSLVSDMMYASDCEQVDAFTMAFGDLVRRLRLRGTLVVAAAGNDRAVGSLPLPACLRDVVSVGAVSKADVIAAFSNVAPGLDLLAPGVAIVSDDADGGTSTASGTSMASPHVAGGIALLLPLISRPFLAALPGVLRANGVPITDMRLCDGSPCSRFPRLDVEAAADWLTSVHSMRTGGGSSRLDCQAEWLVAGSGPGAAKAERFGCEDGDPACDTDSVEGQCTFLVRACFNVPDRRLVTCDPLQAVDAYRLIKPSLTAPRDDTELANAIRVLASLPSTPIDEAGQCGNPFAFVVAVGTGRSVRMATESLRGRDVDRLRFTCRARPIIGLR